MEDPLVAGAFSSHRPRKDCPLMERRQILQTELTSGKTERVNTAVGNPEYERNPYPFIWFSNTSSCIRREVWEKISLSDGRFAEDQDWAKRVLEAGYKTVYVPDSIVIHSHHYSPVKNFRRHFEHAKAMKEIFGKEEFPRFKSDFFSDPTVGQGRFSILPIRGWKTLGGLSGGSSQASSGIYRPLPGSGWEPILRKFP